MLAIEMSAQARKQQRCVGCILQIQGTGARVAEFKGLHPRFVVDVVQRQAAARPARNRAKLVGMLLEE